MFREVSTVEVKEVLRQRQQGRFLREIARGVGLDRKTVRRYLEVAGAASFDPTGSEVGEEVVSAVVGQLRPGRPGGVGRGERWFELDVCRNTLSVSSDGAVPFKNYDRRSGAAADDRARAPEAAGVS
jgi:transposase